jgi:ketosteroid isomerase-like protein
MNDRAARVLPPAGPHMSYFEPVELIDPGEDTVIAVERYGGCAKISRVTTDQTGAVVFTVRDGKLVRGREYLSLERALEAAGLSE